MENLRMVVQRLLNSLTAVGSATLCLCYTFFIFAILGVNVFGGKVVLQLSPGNDIILVVSPRITPALIRPPALA